jgi:aryl-alcohol dehydrogenase-like predicted oxidoreductase/enamine deaminase RidA (YjgF/YER057c/UK114 family)
MTGAEPQRTQLGSLDIARTLVGLWQVADIEKNGDTIDPDDGAAHLLSYARAGFDTFDMADHYGSAEIIAGRMLKRCDLERRPVVCTKWCPAPGPMTADAVKAGVQERLDRLGVDRVDLLQFHWWSFEHGAWLDALHELAELREKGLIAEVGVTNFDADHLRVALSDGIPLVSNQVSFSLIDRRAAGPLSELCRETGVRLLAYGTLCGGFLSERWLGNEDPAEIGDWSKMKYRRFIESIGGWPAFQGILRAAHEIGKKHGVSISNVATRWVLEQEAVAATIIGARLGEAEHSADNARLFGFALDSADHDRLATAFDATQDLPGDCGDEYRRPPFLTASGDLSHHLETMPRAFQATPAHRRDATRVLSGSEWEDVAGYARAQRIGDRVLVSGTTATAGMRRVVAAKDAGAQATYVLDKILAALSALGARTEDVVRTRIYLVDEADAAAVARAHGRVFAEIKPVNTLVVVAGLVGGYRVEIEAEAIVQPDTERTQVSDSAG